jgi:hypothetical protein
MHNSPFPDKFKFIIDEGATIIKTGDKLYVIADNQEELNKLQFCIGNERV